MTTSIVTPPDRIRELGAINADVATMLESAARAVNALTNRSLSAVANDGDDVQMHEDGQNTVEAHKAAFESNTEQFYKGLQAIVARLRRQAYALEEAGIIAVEPPLLSASGSRPVQPSMPGRPNPAASTQAPAMDAITNGGLGNFDVGWLNSRGNKVGAEKEAELVQEAKELLQKELFGTSNG